MSAGDLMRDGCIEDVHGRPIPYGQIWVRGDQAHVAVSAGWRIIKRSSGNEFWAIERDFGDRGVMKTVDVGDAFAPPPEGDGFAFASKTLRDEFAMAALTGGLAGVKEDECWPPEALAKYCYALADAMMKERAK